MAEELRHVFDRVLEEAIAIALLYELVDALLNIRVERVLGRLPLETVELLAFGHLRLLELLEALPEQTFVLRDFGEFGVALANVSHEARIEEKLLPQSLRVGRRLPTSAMIAIV